MSECSKQQIDNLREYLPKILSELKSITNTNRRQVGEAIDKYDEHINHYCLMTLG